MRLTVRGMIFFALAVAAGALLGQQPAQQSQTAFTPSDVTKSFITVNAPVVALEHVRIIDGTGAPARDDQTIVIDGGRIRAMGPAASTSVPSGAQVIDDNGHSVIPGLVGMHDHMFYPSPNGAGGRVQGAPIIYNEMGVSFPRLYLAGGVTTLRTTGTLEPYTDLQLKMEIDTGHMPGPEMFVTGPYLEGAGNWNMVQMHWLNGPEDATRTVNYWIDEGVTSFKAYMHITRAELAAAVKAAHARGIKVTGHLCAVGFTEAAEIGIDDLEHGLPVDTEFNPGKSPDACPTGTGAASTGSVIANLDLNSAPVQNMMHALLAHHVALTSTLPVFEPNRSTAPRIVDALSDPARADFLAANSGRGRGGAANSSRGGAATGNQSENILKNEQKFEYTFAKAGGTLLAGLDPTGYGGVIAGFGDQREVELLVGAGFTPIEAIHIATENGADFLGIGKQTGTLAVGKQADLVVVRGAPDRQINDIENVDTVFRNGVGYDSAKLIASVKGTVGLH